jgi:hypothetical protein
MRAVLSSLLFASAVATTAHAAIKIDGHIHPEDWVGATHITDFRLTQPLSRAPTPYPTEAWILATPEGLAVAFHCTQPPNVPRTHQAAPRDAGGPYDRVNLYVDFDGDGRVGYNFMVMLSDSIQDETITNENQFNADWDGVWEHAVSEDAEGWSVEMLIPWYIAPMKDGHDGKRTIGVQLDRVIGTTGERMGWPAIFGGESRFLSAFAKMDIPAYSQPLLAVTPYVSGLYDNVHHKATFDGGADLFWKPNGKFQLSATLKPDFGQVESDQLVVNFSAVETFFSDKRPFFTENQSFFDVPFGSYNNNDRLIYTRRVGGPADDGSGAGDVAAALKANGSLAGFDYGAFYATEADAPDAISWPCARPAISRRRASARWSRAWTGRSSTAPRRCTSSTTTGSRARPGTSAPCWWIRTSRRTASPKAPAAGRSASTTTWAAAGGRNFTPSISARTCNWTISASSTATTTTTRATTSGTASPTCPGIRPTRRTTGTGRSRAASTMTA